MYCWMNGEYVKKEDLKISPFDHGFLYGIGFFETFRTYEGHVFLLEEHMERLYAALQHFRIAFPYSLAELKAVIAKLDELAGGTDGYFRLNVSAGTHDIGLAPSSYEQPTVILFRKELPPVQKNNAKEGVILMTPRTEPESSVRYKSHHFLNNVEGRLELPSLREHEGIFLTKDGYIAEGVTSNVFWVKNGRLYTPSLETGILAGTTRAVIIDFARKNGFSVEEGLYTVEDLLTADEVFVTNAIQEIVPLKSLENVTYAGVDGSFYQKIHHHYRQAIEESRRL